MRVLIGSSEWCFIMSRATRLSLTRTLFGCVEDKLEEVPFEGDGVLQS